MTPAEERAALERELALELAALGDEGEDDEETEDAEETEEAAYPYQRLDLEAVLQQAASNQDTKDHDVGTWTCLLDSVAFCQAQVFELFNQEMDELKTQLMPQLTAAVESVVSERGLDALSGDTVSSEATPIVLQTEIASRVDRSDCISQVPPGDTRALIQDAKTSLDERIPELPPQLPNTTPSPTVPVRSEAAISPSTTSEVEFLPLTEPQKIPVPTVITIAPPILLQEPQREITPTNKVTERESLRLRAQLNAQHAQDELDAWLKVKQLEIEREQTQRETLQRQMVQERDARATMAIEECEMRSYLNRQRMTMESESMQREDLRSQRMEAALARESHLQQYERQIMAQEEARVWRRVRRERETRRKELLVEEQSRLRRSHNRIMDELVTTLAVKAEAQRKQADQERRREYREASLMRSEEHWTRRVLVHERLVREDLGRQRERRAMEKEDAVGRCLRDNERQGQEQAREERETQAMDHEETRSRVWETLWRLRIECLTKWIHGEEKRTVKRCWREWTSVVVDRRKRDDEHRSDAAARVLQFYARHWLERMRVIEQETSQAARIVQSAYRGFHVRRKFQNALDMAQRMARGSLDEFGEVNLDEWIGAPPELDEDWERPTMPEAGSVQQHIDEPAIQSDEDNEDDESRVEEDEEMQRYEAVAQASQRIEISPNQIDPSPAIPEGGQNLAAVLWNKMRKRTHKQKAIAEERQKQQDPVYRVQKVLGKPAPSIHTNHSMNQHSTSPPVTVTSSVAWATNSDKKKAPKVKLPSLVERLRKKTAAAR